MKAKALVIGFLAVMAAVLTFAKTAGQVLALSQPQLALSMDPVNPDARARMASLLVSKPDTDPRSLDRARTLALEVLKTTPGHVTALRSYGIANAGADPDRAASVMETATAFAKRDSASQMWLVNHYGTRGQEERALTRLGMALRTSLASRPLLFPVLLQTMGRPDSQTAIVKLLAPKTDWSGAFWTFVAGAETLPPNLAQTVADVMGAGGQIPRDDERELVRRLVLADRVAEASALLNTTDPRANVRSLFLGIQRFDEQDLPLPFSWDLVSTGRLYGQAGAPGELRTDVRPGSRGLIARRLITLSSAGGLLTGLITVTGGQADDAPALIVRCARGGGLLASVRPQTSTTAIRATIAVPAGCSQQWIEVISPEVRGGSGSSTTISSLTLHGRSSL